MPFKGTKRQYIFEDYSALTVFFLILSFNQIYTFLGHMSYSGDLLLWVGVRRPLTFSSQELPGQSLPNLVCSICRVRRQEIVNFMTPTPRGDNFGMKSVK